MKTSIVVSVPIATLAIVAMFILPTVLSAEAVNCPTGYVCTAIPPQPVNCPVGYVCLPSNSEKPPMPTPVPVPVPIPPEPCYVLSKNIKVNDSGSEVAELQTRLISNGFDIPAVSSGKTSKGFAGGQTISALMKYQKNVGLPVTRNTHGERMTIPPIARVGATVTMVPSRSF
jgi:hypothetical protein